MPTASMTARTGPPAITPVPSGAGISSTLPVPNTPVTSWGMVVSRVEMVTMCFLASSTPLRMASGISVAFPCRS